MFCRITWIKFWAADGRPWRTRHRWVTHKTVSMFLDREKLLGSSSFLNDGCEIGQDEIFASFVCSTNGVSAEKQWRPSQLQFCRYSNGNWTFLSTFVSTIGESCGCFRKRPRLSTLPLHILSADISSKSNARGVCLSLKTISWCWAKMIMRAQQTRIFLNLRSGPTQNGMFFVISLWMSFAITCIVFVSRRKTTEFKIYQWGHSLIFE